jgi:hypothetical protein
MNSLDFEILDETTDKNGVYLTTHPRITFDSYVESYLVDIGKGAWCEVYGYGRMSRALQIAETCFLEGEPFSE